MSENSEKPKTLRRSSKYTYVLIKCPRCEETALKEIPGIHLWVCQKCSFVVDEEDILKKPRENKYKNIKVGGING